MHRLFEWIMDLSIAFISPMLTFQSLDFFFWIAKLDFVAGMTFKRVLHVKSPFFIRLRIFLIPEETKRWISLGPQPIKAAISSFVKGPKKFAIREQSMKIGALM